MTLAEINCDTGRGDRVNKNGLEKIKIAFYVCNEYLMQIKEDKQFKVVEDFVLLEKQKGCKRKEKVSLIQSAQEIWMAAKIAALAEF